MKGGLLTYLLQFFSGVLIVIIILMSSTILTYRFFQKDLINSKLQAETLSSIISSLSSSMLDYTLVIRVGSECKISISDSDLKATIGSDEYKISIIMPTYVKLKKSESNCKGGLLYIYKKGDEIWLE